MKAADTEAAFRGDSAKAESGGTSDQKSGRFAANLAAAAEAFLSFSS